MMKKILLLLILAMLSCVGSFATKTRTPLQVRPGKQNKVIPTRRAPIRIQILATYDSECESISISGPENMQAEVYIYDEFGHEVAYSPVLNSQFIATDSGIYTIEVKGSGWIAEGQIETE